MNVVMNIQLEIFERTPHKVFGAMWLDNGTAIPFEMPTEAYKTAMNQRLFEDEEIENENGAINESPVFRVIVGDPYSE